MNELFIRIFYKNHYYEYILKESQKVNLDFLNSKYYVILKNQKIISNFINNKDYQINRIYNNSEFSYMIGIYSKEYYIQSRHFNINKIIFNTCNVEVDLKDKYIEFTTPIYIEKKLYIKGKFYFNNTLSFCVEGHEFIIRDNIVYFRQKSKYKNFKFGKSIYYPSSKVLINKNYTYNFKYDYMYKTKNDGVSRFIIPPLIMLCVMVFVAVFTKRVNMIIFMGASSLSTVTASLIMYLKERNKVLKHNEFVNQNFESKVKTLTTQINNDLKFNYKSTVFKLLNIKNCFGYILVPVKIDYEISENNLKNKFDLLYLKLGKFHYGINFKDVSITGKYAYLYLNNLLLSIIGNDFERRVVFIGNFNKFPFIKNAMYYQNTDDIENLKNCLIITNIKCNVNSLKEYNQIISIGVDNSSDNILIINSIFRNRLTKYKGDYCNKDFFIAIENSPKVLYLASQKIIFDNSEIKQEDKKGLLLGRGYIFDIEKYGPHGLIVGMTGSGKSILLLQMILEISSAYSPNEAVISIIDFKGDSLISRVSKLPHISSTFSNLNGGYENIIASINYEMKYRQELFSKHRVSEYNELTPGTLPRLFLIIDEFAELIKYSATITEEIESIARVGRSLGIFMIISLQKSSGIVTQQLKSNLNYKVCLKVNSVADSMDVIGTKSAIYFKTPGEAILSVNNSNDHFIVDNCLDYMKEDIIIDKVQELRESVIDYTTEDLCNKYEKTNYTVWKTLPSNEVSKILLNVIYSKTFHTYQCAYDNYIIVGKANSGKSELVKTLVKDFKECIIYLGNNNSFERCVDMYIDSISQISVFISYMKCIKVKALFIIDGLELFSNNELLDFIEECAHNKYSNVKVILVMQSVTTNITRIIKLFNHKFMLSVNDPSEYYNLFYKNFSRINFNEGEGVCLYNDEVVEFKNYQSVLNPSLKSYAISKKYKYLNIYDFNCIDLSEAICIYDNVENDLDDFYKSFHYSSIDETLIRSNNNRRIVTNTSKFEYRYRKMNIIDEMMYDVINECTIVCVNNLKFK